MEKYKGLLSKISVPMDCPKRSVDVVDCGYSSITKNIRHF